MLVRQNGEARDDCAKLFAACFLSESKYWSQRWLLDLIIAALGGICGFEEGDIDVPGITDLTLRV